MNEEPTEAKVPEFHKWQCMLDNEDIRAVARHAYIYSVAPDEIHPHHKCGWMALWEKEQLHEGYTAAVARINQLLNLRAVTVRFARWRNPPDHDDTETPSTRQDSLRAILEAIRRQASSYANASAVRSLTILNLDIASSVACPKQGLENITELHLRMIQAFSRVSNIDRNAQREFEPHLYAHWLIPLADQLTSLTLYLSPLPWGLIPACFDGRGLKFPNLRELALGNFVIGHDDHFDWVLNQKSLRRLSLDQCYVASHIHLTTKIIKLWNIRTDDWVRLPSGAFGYSEPSDAVYRYPGTWGALFDRIRCELPHLADFHFACNPKPTRLTQEHAQKVRFRQPLFTCTDPAWMVRRYIAIDCAGQRFFRDIDDESGRIVFGNSEDWYNQRHWIIPAKEHQQVDERALKDLLQAVKTQASR
jgi:hypothetical protein